MTVDNLELEISASSDSAVKNLKETKSALKEVKAVTDEKFKNPLAELANATEVDTLRAKLASLKKGLEEAIAGGKASKAINYRLQILRTEKAIKNIELAALKATETNEKMAASFEAVARAAGSLKDSMPEDYDPRHPTTKPSKWAEELRDGISKSENPGLKSIKDALDPNDVEAAENAVKKATSVLSVFGRALESVRSVFRRTSDTASTSAKSIRESVEDMKESASGATADPVSETVRHSIENASKLDVMRTKLALLRLAMKEAFDDGNVAKANNIRGQILNLESALEKAEKSAVKADESLKKVKKSIGETFMKGIGSVAKRVGNGIAGAFKRIGDRAKESVKPINNFLSSLGRIAFYRLIRAMIKAIAQAFKEGLENAYKFSAGIATSGHRFAEAMDSMKSSSTQMKAQLGSAFISLLAAIRPVVNALINLVIMAANALSQLIAAFTGSTYLRANIVADHFADTMEKGGAAAKEWKNQLLGFDEINRLEEPNSGGGGGGASGIDPSKLYQDTKIDEAIKKFVDDFKSAIRRGDWSGAGKMLGEKIMSLFPSAEKWREWGEKLGRGLDGVLQTIYSTIHAIDFGDLGGRIAGFFNGMFERIDFSYLGALLVNKFTVALDFFGGFLGTLDWGELGKAIGDFLLGALDEASTWLSNHDWEQIGRNIYTKFKELIRGINFKDLARSFFRFLSEAFVALKNLLKGFFAPVIERLSTFFHDEFGDIAAQCWEGFKVGLTGALFGTSSTFSGVPVETWMDKNFAQPVIVGAKVGLKIGSPSKEFEEVGRYTIEGFRDGMDSAWSIVEHFFDKAFGGLFTWCRSAHDWIQDILTGIGLINSNPPGSTWSSGGGFSGSKGKFASGGFPMTGQLFLAREAGPELVGTMNGQTAVANNDQIISGIRQGVYEAVSAAMNGQGGETVVRVYLDSREIKTGQQRLARAMG